MSVLMFVLIELFKFLTDVFQFWW